MYAQCRPAVILSYLIGGLIALITACNYAEMGADFPLAGASFNYVLAVWGEFPAWCAYLSASWFACQSRNHCVQCSCSSYLHADLLLSSNLWFCLRHELAADCEFELPTPFMNSGLPAASRITIVAIAIDAMLGAGALARGWSSYLASLCNQSSTRQVCSTGTSVQIIRMAAAAPADLWLVTMPGMHSKPSQGRFSACRAVQPWCGASLPGLMYRFLVQTSHHELDFVAFGLIILVMLLIGWGTHQTSIVNSSESQPSGSTSFMPSESSSASGPCSGMRLLTGTHACKRCWLGCAQKQLS